MSDYIKVLLLEDDSGDAEIIRYNLLHGDLECKIKTVESCKAFEHSLSKGLPDIVLSDYLLPDGNGYEALQCCRKYSATLPFIFVTGVLGEERAVAAFKEGATDFVLKHRLGHLVPAVLRALRETKEHIQRMQAETQYRELSAHLQQLLEDERTRIARLVHDELGQSLAGLKFDLAGLAGKLPIDLKDISGKIKDMMRDTDHAILIVRKIITDLRPGILDDLGIVAALEWQAADFQKRTGIKCKVTTTLEDAVRHPELDTVIFRIFQGLLANIHQHAGCREVKIHSTVQNEEYILVVEDNGVGLPLNDSENNLTMGILGMREQASEYGGTIVYERVQPHGTRVIVNLPWQKTSTAHGGGV